MKNRAIWFLFSCICVAYAQPERYIAFSFIASITGLALFFYSIDDLSSKKSVFFLGSTWFFIIQCFQLLWMANSHYLGNAIYPAYLVLALWLGAQWGGLSLLFFYYKRVMSFWHILTLSFAWVFVEYSRLFISCGFPFNPLGQVWMFSPLAIQMASLFGILGISFWALLTNLFVYKTLKNRSPTTCLIALLCGAFPYLFGYGQQLVVEPEILKSDRFNVCLLQTGLAAEEKTKFLAFSDRYLSPFQQWSRIFALTRESVSQACDMIILPESAVPDDAFHCHLDHKEIQQLFVRTFGTEVLVNLPVLQYPIARKNSSGEWRVSNAFIAQGLANVTKISVLSGMLYYDEVQDKMYNSAIQFTPYEDWQMYHKRVLVPFSEYLPSTAIRSFMAKRGIEHFFTHGKEPRVFHGQVMLAPSVCYEECFSHLAREGKSLGAQLFVNLSNDVWFPHSRLAKDHFHLGRLRSIENGVPVLRCCNTGVTVGIDSLGREVQRLPEETANGDWVQQALIVSLPLHQWKTVYSRYGNAPLLLLGSIHSGIFLFSFLYRKGLWKGDIERKRVEG